MKTECRELIRELKSLSQKDAELAGAKAANLGELARAGFRVPDGFVLTVQAFKRFVDANRLSASSPPEEVESAAVPEEVSHALLKAAHGLEGIPLAVRSSGVAEDLKGASFAGQYETVLNVLGTEALLAAVRRCWASAFGPRVAAYKESKAVVGVPNMALLVQRMVTPDAAGVAFTANPVSGDLDEVVVSAVRGLGERLVSGQVSPDEWSLKYGRAVCRSSPEGAIDAAQAREIADMAKRAEVHFGCPQDIEWAISGSQLFLLQSRPITTLPGKEAEKVPVPVEVPPGFWERESSHFWQPPSPLLRTTYLPAQIAGLAAMCQALYLPFEKMDYREIGGWVYQHMVPLGGKDRNPPPNWLMYLLLRLLPAMRSRVKGMARLIRDDISSSYIDQWFNEWKPGQIERIAELRAVELPALSDQDLDRHLAEVLAFFGESARIHGLVMGTELANAFLAFTCRDLFGWDDVQTLRLLSGLSATTSSASLRLAGLSQMVREQPKLRQLLEAGSAEQTMEQLANVAPDFARAFASYQQDFGCRAVAFEVALPTIAETPALTIGLILNQARRSYDPQTDAAVLAQERNSALAAANELLAHRSPQDRQRFERDLNRAQRAYPIREDHELYLGQAPLALLRYTALEIGRRLAQRDQLAERDDVFWLELPELQDALRSGGDHRPLVQRRKAERAWAEAHPGPASYGKPAGKPPASLFPRDSRVMMSGVIWTLDRAQAIEQSAQTQEGGDTIRGIAASCGTYTGTARVVLNEGQFSKVKAGDVLVCPTTSPVWSMLFPSIGALVTDSGGILSHPAIIAREYRVPAVVATGNATQLLRDGQRVTVDGSAGRVQVESQ